MATPGDGMSIGRACHRIRPRGVRCRRAAIQQAGQSSQMNNKNEWISKIRNQQFSCLKHNIECINSRHFDNVAGIQNLNENKAVGIHSY
ncbi:hypothetical protein [Achromobacter xylosoxidans]|uniref:hypothetical protein n=1 Tax=Alcaligenes xylosoxydans xylosoxydans TaxID=85698 RepID=UPI0022B93E8D|nr:hypothetical protein [Achromobacter xylosoxidans]MCZ8393058.1 hypothetical protein [Achromobacter xylosoxidans]